MAKSKLRVKRKGDVALRLSGAIQQLRTSCESITMKSQECLISATMSLLDVSKYDQTTTYQHNAAAPKEGKQQSHCGATGIARRRAAAASLPFSNFVSY